MKDRTLRFGLVVSFLCTSYIVLFRSFPLTGDVLLGLPLGRAIADPGLYPETDILVTSGLRGPFHLYKYFGGLLFGLDLPVDVVWYGCFILVTLITFFVLWNLFNEVGNDPLVSSVACALLVCMHPLRGSLLASSIPVGGFVTAQVALPVALFSIVLVLRARYVWAMVAAGATFLVHPYVGVIIVSAIALVTLTAPGSDTRLKIRAIAFGLLTMAPNVVYLLTRLPEVLVSEVVSDPPFQEQFRLYALHAFIGTHWREGFGWFAVMMAGALLGMKFIPDEKQRALKVMGCVWFFLMGLYALNSVTVEHPTVYLSFLFRATYFLKPLGMILSLLLLRTMWVQFPQRRSITMLTSLLLFVGAALPMSLAVVADVLACLGLGLLVPVVRRETVFSPTTRAILTGVVLVTVIEAIAELNAEWKDSLQDGVVMLVIVLAAGMWVAMRRSIPAPESRTHAFVPAIRPVLILIVLHHLIISAKDWTTPFVPHWEDISGRVFFFTPPPRSAAVMEWVSLNTPRRSMFVVPPGNEPDLEAFRLITGRGVYATVGEVNQIAFDRTLYSAIHNRLLRLGVSVTGPRTADTRGYEMLTAKKLRAVHESDGVDFALFHSEYHPFLGEDVRPAYADSSYVVYDLREWSDLNAPMNKN